MYIYEILEQILTENDISVAEAARKSNLSDSTVRGIIKRKQKHIALDVAFKLSDGLGVSLERLNGMPEKIRAPIELENKKTSPSTAEAVLEDIEESEFKPLVDALTPDQKDFLLAVLKTLLERDK